MKQLISRATLALAALTVAALAVIPLATARIDRQAPAAATTVQVKGGEFFLKLTTRSLANRTDAISSMCVTVRARMPTWA